MYILRGTLLLFKGIGKLTDIFLAVTFFKSIWGNGEKCSKQRDIILRWLCYKTEWIGASARNACNAYCRCDIEITYRMNLSWMIFSYPKRVRREFVASKFIVCKSPVISCCVNFKKNFLIQEEIFGSTKISRFLAFLKTNFRSSNFSPKQRKTIPRWPPRYQFSASKQYSRMKVTNLLRQQMLQPCFR